MTSPRGYGSHDLDAIFPDQAPITVVPWPSLARPLRIEGERDRLRSLLSGPPLANTFVDLDPRELLATQPFVIRAGVQYYLDDGYRRHGRTYADQFKIGNKFPVVYRSNGKHMILSGHHRAAAALLSGKPYRARVFEGPDGPKCGGHTDVMSLERAAINAVVPAGAAVFLTPSLLIGEQNLAHLGLTPWSTTPGPPSR